MPRQGRACTPRSGKTQAPVEQPTSPLPTGSGAHGLRGHVNALAGVLASKHALAECGPNASVMKAAAAEVAHVGGPRCRTAGCSCRCYRARGTLGRRTPCRRRAPQAPVKWWVETLSRCAVEAMQSRPSSPWAQCSTQEVAPQGSAFGALHEPTTGLAPFDRSRGGSLTATYRWLILCARAGRNAKIPARGKTQTPVEQPTPPLPTGSGAHGLRGHVNALAGVLASKHALAECGPNASAMKAAAAEVAHVGGPRCRTQVAAAGAVGHVELWDAGRHVAGARLSTCKVVGGNPQPLRSDSHAPVGPWPLARITLGL